MKKVWVYKRKRVKGWWCGWYESGKRKSKALPSKELAEHYKQIKYTQLNSDVFTGEKLTAKNTRYCVNSLSLNFIPSGKFQKN